jgi:hypothetical protein
MIRIFRVSAVNKTIQWKIGYVLMKPKLKMRPKTANFYLAMTRTLVLQISQIKSNATQVLIYLMEFANYVKNSTNV